MGSRGGGSVGVPLRVTGEETKGAWTLVREGSGDLWFSVSHCRLRAA